MSIYSGGLDLNALENIIVDEGKVRNISKLHSKIYLFDNQRVIISSANLTNGGLINNYEYGIYTEDKNIVFEIVKDFKDLTDSPDTGCIKKEDINTVRKILSNVPKTKSIKLPKYELGTQEENLDIIELPFDILSKSLKGWQLEVLKCVKDINNQTFSLAEINTYIPQLQKVYPANKHISDKIRQQLQFLRDLGLLEFKGNGNYKKLWK